VAAGAKWRSLDRAWLWVWVEKPAVVGGCLLTSGLTVTGDGMAHTLFGWKGAAVVMVAATVAAEGLGVGLSAGSEMDSGGGKGRKQGMDE